MESTFLGVGERVKPKSFVKRHMEIWGQELVIVCLN